MKRDSTTIVTAALRALCDAADFVDSGFQCFAGQVQHMPKERQTRAAFYAGAGLALKLMELFQEHEDQYRDSSAEYLVALLCKEVDDYMEANRMKIEWQPHVPTARQQ